MNELHRPYTRIYRVRTQAVPMDRSRITFAETRRFLGQVLVGIVAFGAIAAGLIWMAVR